MNDGQIADLVDDEQLGPAEEAQPLAQIALPLGLGERGYELGQGAEVDAAPGLDGLDAESDGKMRLAAARLAQEVDDLAAVDELELRQGKDAVAVERGLEAEVEAGEGLEAGQPPHLERRLDAPAFAQGELFAQERVDRLERADFAALELAHDVIEHLERARHFEPHQMSADLIDGARHGIVASHARLPSPASRRATAS